MNTWVGPADGTGACCTNNQLRLISRLVARHSGRIAALTTLAVISLPLLAADPKLNLPTLIAADSELAVAVFRSQSGELVLHDKGQAINSGRWQLESVSSDSALLRTVDRSDPEASSHVRIFDERSGRTPMIIRIRPPDQPPAPRLVIQTAKVRRQATQSDPATENSQ